MKRILSLIMAVSIFLQIVVPVGSKVTYAQTIKRLYEFQWEENKRLSDELKILEIPDAGQGSEEALVSWVPGESRSKYELEYFIENLGKPEMVRFTFQRNVTKNDEATVTFEVLEKDGITPIKKDYYEHDFNNIIPGGGKEHLQKEGPISIDIKDTDNFPGGRVNVDGMEIRFRWKDGNVHFQTSNVKHGNITPFKLTHAGDTLNAQTIEVLTGIAGYKVSPVHIQTTGSAINATISNKETIKVPEENEAPGSKPGIRLDFNRPKRWTDAGFKTLKDPDELKNIMATLVLEDLTETATAQLTFDLGQGTEIKGLAGKKLIYNDTTDDKTYTLYLAKDDKDQNGKPHENIVKWEKLNDSMVLKTVRLSLMRPAPPGGEVQSLGRFTLKTQMGGQHTYLGYSIHRSSMEEAFIKVQPYNAAKNTEYKYFVEYGDDGAGWTNLVEHTYRATGEAREKEFTIPVPFSSNFDKQYYRIRATYNDVVMYSQTLYYEPKEDSSVPPPTPVIKSIDNIYAVPPITLGDPPEAIGFDLTWSAPKNSSQNELLNTLVNNGSIYYELFFHEDLESTESTEGKGTLIKVFKVRLEGKEIVVEAHEGTAGNGPTGKDPAKLIYNSSKETFTVENIVLKNPGKSLWEQIKIENHNIDYEKRHEYPSDFKATNDMPEQEVPGVYYFTMRALYETDKKDPTDKDTLMGVSGVSNPKSITISPLEEVIPVPTKIESKHSPVEDDPNIIRETFSWGNVNLYRYIKQMLDPLNLYIGGKGKGVYEVYLHQNKNIKESELTALTTPTAIVLDTKPLYELERDDIENLRKGGVIRLDYPGVRDDGMNSILLEGLDANQVYYTTIRVRLDLKDKDDKIVLPTRYSVFSKEYSFTTYTKPSEPGPGERVPPVPEELQIIDQPNNTTATIGWKAPEYSKQEDEVLYYEMIRVDSRKLAKEEDSRLLSIKNLLGNNKENDMHAWRTKGPLVDQYTKSTDTWSEATPQQASNKLQLEDSQLSPNQIYYYYVRTVLIVEGEEVYSSWVGIPVTTDPVQKPIMLKVEDKDAYSHDPKREIVISFLAPVPKGANIPSEYDFDIAVQGELDDNYRLDYSTTRLTSKEKDVDIPTGYAHFVYRINNVKPGKRYDIKVRIIDKVVDMVNGQYPKSLYSDRVTTRTHFDQDEQDKDDKFEEYLKYFEDKVEALRRKSYWTLEDGAKSFSIKYRSNYIIPELNSTKSYNLAIKEDVTDFNYYMPASVIASTNISQTSFEIKQGNVTYSVRPSTITTELEELKTALEDIKDKYIRDYYVSFNFSQRPQRTNSTIDGFLTPEITVDIELVTLKEEDLLIEDDIMVSLNNQINKEKTTYINDLEKALDRGKISNEDLDIIIDRSIGYIEKSHQKDVRNIIGRGTKKVTSIDKWNKSMLIMATIEGNAVAQGYQLGRTETALTTFNVGRGYGIEITEAGTYIFKGQKVNMPVIPGVGGAGGLIAKYQLTDFFGTNGNIDPSKTAIKKDVLGAMARVLGAPRGADYVQYLKQVGIKGVNNIGMDAPIKKGEGIYLLMQVYEKNLKKPIGSVYVKNRNIVSNIQQFNRIHQPYVLVAVDSKIVGQGSGLRPNDSMEIKDVLQVLTNITAEVR